MTNMNHCYENDFGYVFDCPWNLHQVGTKGSKGDFAVKRALQTLAANGVPHELLFPIERYWMNDMNLLDLASMVGIVDCKEKP